MATPEISGGGLLTWTETGADTVELPAPSRAVAVTVCVPDATPRVLQETVYGERVASVPTAAPSTRNCTPATPTSSLAVAASVTVPLRDAPDAGDVTATVGAVLSPAPTSRCPGTFTTNASSRPVPAL